MKIILLGCGKVGRSIAAQLAREGHDITLIDRNAAKLTDLTSALDVVGVIGNGVDYEVQMEAGVQGADLLIAVTAQDEINLLSCLIAKKAGGCSTIARVRNPDYGKGLHFIREELGLSMTINPELAAAREISRLLRFPSAIKAETFAKGRVEMLQLRIPQNSPLHAMPISELRHRVLADTLIAIVERDGKIEIPSGATVLHEGDLITAIVPPHHASAFFRKIGVPDDRIRSAMLVGGGKIGYFVAKQLTKSGMDVKILERDFTRCEFLSERLPRATIINADGTDRDVLMEEGIADAESFASLTDFDEENILLSLYAGTQTKGKIITKVNRVNYGGLVDSLPVGSLIYPRDITATAILRYVRAMQNSLGSNVETLYQLRGAEALEFRVHGESALTKVPLEQLNLRANLLIACINRAGDIILPYGRDVILPGDTVIVVTTNTGLKDLRDIMEA